MDATAIIIVLAWAYVVLPRLTQSLTAAKHRATIGEPVPQSPWANLVEQGITVVLLLVCVVVVVRGTVWLPARRRLALLALLAPWAYLVARDLYVDTKPNVGALLFPALVVALWVLQPPLHRLALLGRLVGATAVLGIVMGVVIPGRGIYVSASGAFVDPDKQLLPIGILIGPFTDGNNLAQFLVIGIASLGLVAGRHRLLLWTVAAGGAVLAALVWTSSRSSLVALLAGAVTVAVLVAAPRRYRPTLTVAAVGVAAVVVAAAPLLTTDPAAFTNRGAIWRASLHAWEGGPVFGLGSRWYSRVGDFTTGLGGFSYHGHNQFVQTLVTGGLVYLVLSVVLLATVTLAASRLAGETSVLPAAGLVIFLMSCTQEVSFGVVDRGFLLCVTVLPMAVVAFAPVSSRR